MYHKSATSAAVKRRDESAANEHSAGVIDSYIKAGSTFPQDDELHCCQ